MPEILKCHGASTMPYRLCMDVFIVELRVRAYTDLDDCIDVHVASTLEKAISWCQDNLRYEPSRDNLQPWTFAICSEVVDSNETILDTNMQGFVSHDGVFSPECPAYYREPLAPGRDS